MLKHDKTVFKLKYKKDLGQPSHFAVPSVAAKASPSISGGGKGPAVSMVAMAMVPSRLKLSAGRGAGGPDGPGGPGGPGRCRGEGRGEGKGPALRPAISGAAGASAADAATNSCNADPEHCHGDEGDEGRGGRASSWLASEASDGNNMDFCSNPRLSKFC